jgi:NAD(P)-dependent dehydrogenase (short-subunit alcohol dehydrogenase family)
MTHRWYAQSICNRGTNYMQSSSSEPFGLLDKVALVTGASSGLGRRFSLLLAQRGARVGLAARRVDALESVAKEIAASGGIAFATRLDVASEASVQTAVAAVEKALGPIDILVNNSGTNIAKPALDQTAEDWDTVMNVNLRGVFLMAKEVAKRMRDSTREGRGGGSIINIASILATRQSGFVLPYAVSKAGVVQLTKSLALEVARYGIRVNAIAPGYIETDINREFFATDAGAAMIKRIPQRHIGKDSDLDGALLLLASDASRFMTGSVVTVDGGHLVSSL